MQSLMPIHCFLFEIQIIKNGFTVPISYRVFRETGPRSCMIRLQLTRQAKIWTVLQSSIPLTKLFCFFFGGGGGGGGVGGEGEM